MLFSVALKDNKAFNRAFRTGRFCACAFLTAYYLPNGLDRNRVGISVSKKVGNAVCRNRAKRIIRAAYRLNEDMFRCGLDIVFAVRPAIDGLKTQDIEGFFRGRLMKDMASAFDENGEFIRKPRKSASAKEKQKPEKDNGDGNEGNDGAC